MLIEPNVIKQMIIATVLTGGGLLLGLIFEKVIMVRLKRVATTTKWEIDEIMLDAVHGKAVLWFILAGFYATLHSVSLPHELFSLLQKALLIVFLFSATMVMARLVTSFVGLYAKRTEGILPSASIFVNIANIVVFLLGILVILQSLGISITPILTALGVGGLAVALALQDTLANLFSGLHILASQQIKPGDYIKLATGEEGSVVDITWRSTSIKALPNNMIIIPNAKLSSAIITNFTLPEADIGFVISIGVSYNSDLAKVEKVAVGAGVEIMREVQGGVPDFVPVIRYHTFNDSSIDFNVVLRAQTFADQFLIKHEFIKRLHQRFAEESIEIPFPITTVYLKNTP